MYTLSLQVVQNLEQVIHGEVIRGKFRDSIEKLELFVPGKPTKVEFAMLDIFHTFRNGRRMMIQIQSTWFPLINMNPQQFLNTQQRWLTCEPRLICAFALTVDA